MFSVDIHFNHPKKIGFIFLLKLTCLINLIMGCSSKHQSDITTLKDEMNTEMSKSKNVVYSTSMLGLYDVSSFDAYVDDDQIIHLIASGKRAATDQQTVIRYTRSENGGHHWMDTVSIDKLPTVIGKRGNDIQLVAKDQNLVAIWQTEGKLPATGPMVSAFSSDGGKTWSTGIPPALDNEGNQAYIDLIADQQGTFHAIWLEDPEENGYQSLRYARSTDYGKQWSQPITLDESTCSCCWNTLASFSDNHLNVLYRDMTPRDMSLMQSPDGGLTWQKISVVGDFQWNFEGCPHIGGGLKSIRFHEHIQLHGIVWTGAEDKSGLYHVVSSNHGHSWSAPTKLGDMATNGDVAALVGHHGNTIAAIWNEIEPGGMNILLSKSADGGIVWSTPLRLSHSSHAPTHPKLVAIRDRFLALWTEKNLSHTDALAWYVFE